MSNKKHIDRLFQEKLKDFEVFPDAEAWKNIEEQLVRKKKRRVLPLWLRLGSAAAILLLLTTGGIWFYNDGNNNVKTPNTNSIITDVDKEDNNNDLNETVKPAEEKVHFKMVEEENGSITATSKSASDLNKTNPSKATGRSTIETISSEPLINNSKPQNNDLNSTKVAQSNEVEKLVKNSETLDAADKVETTIAATTKPKEELETPAKKDINEALKEEKESIALTEKNSNDKKWSVGSTVAPIYFNTLSEGSPIHSVLAENEKKSITSLSYGVKVNYKINDKLSLQSGINSLDLAYQTKNVSALITSTEGLSNDTNINTNVDGIKIVTSSNNNNAAVQRQEFASFQNGNLANLNGDLNQTFSYIEVPVEAKYALLRKKLGVNVIGGLSTYVLYNKGVTIQNENGSTMLGEASNINDLNFSGNVGIDVDYNINKKLYINVSPMFKYQFNTFSKNDGGFQPYYLGIYTGLNFRF